MVQFLLPSVYGNLSLFDGLIGTWINKPC